MYHPTKVNLRIENEIKNALQFSPIYRSVDEVDAYEIHLKQSGKYIYDDAGRPLSCHNLEPWEIQWQVNERALVMCDATYALTRYCFVVNEEGVIQRFVFRVAQQILFGIISDLEAMDVAIEILILKARQLGVTTLVELLIMLRIVFSYGTNSVIASADRQKSLMMAKKLFMAYDMLPLWLRPQYTARVESDQGKLEFGPLNSGVSIQHGNQMSGIARGATPTIWHLSEIGSFSNAKEQIEASLFRAVHPSPSIFGIGEGTGEGDVGWLADTWRFSKANWSEGLARLCPCFLPWFVGLDIYPKPAWLRAHPVPPSWYEHRLPDTREHVAKAECYVSTHEMIRRHLCVPHPSIAHEGKSSWWTDGRMPIEQQYFWEVGHEEAKAKGLESTWFQEMAGDDLEALQRSSESIFGHEVTTRMDSNRKKDYSVYAFSGQSIEDSFEPPTEDIDYSKSRLPVKYSSPRGEVYRWELIPLKHDHARIEGLKHTNPDAFWDYAHTKFFVFHPPTRGTRYSVGIDTAGGDGGDSTVISVTELAPRSGMPDIQAAEFRSAFVSHAEAYAFAMCICAFYGQYAETPTDYPLVGVEVVASAGDTCQLQMRKMGYTHFFLFTRIDSKRIQPAKSNKMGWYTYSWARSILMTNFIMSVKNEWYEINSLWTIYELEHFEAHVTSTGRIKEEHEDGEHDDGIFAGAISIQIARGLQSMTERSKKRFMGDLSASKLPPIDVSPWSGRSLSPDPARNPSEIDLRDIVF